MIVGVQDLHLHWYGLGLGPRATPQGHPPHNRPPVLQVTFPPPAKAGHNGGSQLVSPRVVHKLQRSLFLLPNTKARSTTN